MMSILSAALASRSIRSASLGMVFVGSLAASLLVEAPTWAHDGEVESDDVVLPDVQLRPGVTTDLHLRVLRKHKDGCGDRAIVAVHGAAATANTLVDLGEAMLAASGDGEVCRFVALDLPGHGGSALPDGTLFGDLALSDYAAALLGTLDRLEDQGIRTHTVVGHSMGGIVVQLAQQTLIDGGSSLRDAHDVRHAVLFAPVPPQAVPCAYCQNQQVAAVLGQFIGFDPVLGPRFLIPDALWPNLVFMTPAGTLATNAPTPAEVTAFGYSSVESLTALSDMLGIPPLQRPDVDAGIFGHGYRTKLDVVEFQNDAIIAPSEGPALHEYLLGDSDDQGFATVDGANAVHGLPISDPKGMLASLVGRLAIP